MNNFKYIIFESSEQHLLELDEFLNFSAEPIRRSNDGVHSYAKYIGDMPSSVQSLTTKSQEYTYQEIESVFANENWNTPIPF